MAILKHPHLVVPHLHSELWHVAKTQLLKRLILFQHDGSQFSFEQEVLTILNGISPDICNNILKANRAYLCQYLALAAKQEVGPHQAN